MGVALVAARTREIAEAAVKLIQVEYEPLPVVSDPEAALLPDAPRIHGEDNQFVHHKVRKGDVEKGFARGGFRHRAEVSARRASSIPTWSRRRCWPSRPSTAAW